MYWGYSPPSVDRLWDIWGPYYNVPRAIFYLLKGDFRIHKGMWWCLSGIVGDDFENAAQCYQYDSAGQVRAEVEIKITMIAINANNNSDNRSKHARTWRWPLDVARLAGI